VSRSVVAPVPAGGVATPEVGSQVGSRVCERCGVTIEHPRPGQRFCSSGCRWEAWKAARQTRDHELRLLAEALRMNAEALLERLGPASGPTHKTSWAVVEVTSLERRC
jgi:hypothetical protein